MYSRLSYLPPLSVPIYLTKYMEFILPPVSSKTCTDPRKLSHFHGFQDYIFLSAEVHRDSTQSNGLLNMLSVKNPVPLSSNRGIANGKALTLP